MSRRPQHSIHPQCRVTEQLRHHVLVPAQDLWVADASLDLDPDAFCWRALGWSAAHVYAALDPAETATAGQIAGLLGVTPRTVQRHLARMGKVGLARREADG